jgi:hypothetical protein
LSGLSLPRLLKLDGRESVARAMESSVVVPVDPLEGRKLDLVECLPRSSAVDQLGLVEPDRGLGERVDAPIVVKSGRGRVFA